MAITLENLFSRIHPYDGKSCVGVLGDDEQGEPYRIGLFGQTWVAEPERMEEWRGRRVVSLEEAVSMRIRFLRAVGITVG